MTTVHLGLTDVALAAVLVLANAVASMLLRLRLHRQVLWAATRMVVQLLLVGLFLRVVFRLQSPSVTVLVILLMIGAAAREVAVRPERRLQQHGNYHIGFAVVGISSVATVALALMTAVRPQPWYDPRYAIPLMGIVLGSVLNSASLGLDCFFEGVANNRQALEAQLTFGGHQVRGLRRTDTIVHPSRHDSYHQSDVGRRDHHAARNHDWPAARRHGPDRSGEVPDPPALSSDRRRGLGIGRCGVPCGTCGHG